MLKVGYLDELKEVDQKILSLLAERAKTAAGQRYMPPADLMLHWAETFHLDLSLIKWLFHGLNQMTLPVYGPIDTGDLQTVVPIMKKIQVEECEYQLTHMMQYVHASEVILEIRANEDPVYGFSSIRPQLILNVEPDNGYFIQTMGFQGGGNRASLKFIITPKLPEDLSELSFSLQPNYQPFRQMKEKILDQPVRFD
ncbi:MAG: hypothetical protein JWN30_86 [Bacilli bacterium]|nr:hypothetical protein [Bacilli bacterium]